VSNEPERPSHEELLERQAFQLRLLDAMRRSDDAEDILAATAQLLGEHLAAGRCGFATISEDGTRAYLDADWSSSLPSLAGETRVLDSFGPEIIAELRLGRTLAVSDSDIDPRTRAFAEGWRTIGSRALLVCPIFREGRLDSVLYVHDASPRVWTGRESLQVQDVALRTRDAVDRARSEVALRSSELRYRSLFNSIDAGFCVVEVVFDDDGKASDYRFIEVNDSFEAYTGIAEAPGRWMREIAPAHEQHWFDLYGRVAKTGISERIELPARQLADRWYAVQAYRVDDPARHHVAVLFTDLTVRRRTERALERSREELELAVRAAELGRFDYRPREGTLTWDDRCRELFGLSPGVSVSYETAFLAGLHPEDRDRADRAVAASLDPDGSHHFEVEYRTIGIEDGELRHISAHGLAFFDGRAPVRLIGTVQDVTSDREANAALRETGERLRLAGRATNDAVWDWDLRADLVTWNEALTHAYGHAPEKVAPTGEWWLAQIHPDDATRIHDSIFQVIGSQDTDWSDEYRFRRADGSYADVLDRGYVIRDEAGRPQRMVGAMQDVSARKAVERQLEEERRRLHDEVVETAAERDRAEEALRQSQKMEAVGQLTGGLAHDFNNLLAGISGALEMMQTRIAQGRTGELEKYSTAAQGAVRRAAALTHRLLAFSRRQTLAPTPTNVDKLVAGIEDMVRRTVGPHVEVQTSSHGGLWSTLVDPNQLENALLNLCINARDAMPDGGLIRISSANVALSAQQAREHDLQPGEYVELSVADTGTGMAREVVARAFDPFFTTKPIGEGTGLGLSMIYGFARQSGGQIDIETEPGCGTTMRLYLPRHATLEASAIMVPVLEGEPAAEQPRRVGRVLVVDDEPTVRMLVVEVVEELGYRVLEAQDGPSAMRVIDSGQPIDLLVTDVGLPGGMNGRQIADAALTRLPSLKVLFITGYAEQAVMGSGQLAKNMAIMTKPFAMDALADRIREIADQP